jgi:hypothetical protein
MHNYEPAPRLSQVAPQLPAELDALIAKLLIKSPADRTPSAAYALAALERVPLAPLEGEIQLSGPGGARAATYSPSADLMTVMAPEPAPSIPPPSRALPVAIVLIALAIAAAAAAVIGFI